MSDSGHIARMGRWVASLAFEDIPHSVIDRVKHQTLSVFAAIYCGAATEAGSILARVCTRPDDTGASAHTIGHSVTVEEAVRLHAGLSVALDFDDYLFLGHTGHSAIPVPIAVGQARNLSGKRVLEAMVAANEIAGRLGASTLVGPHNGQLWIFIHAAGAAAATAKLLGLSAEQTAHALAIALFAPPFTQWPSAMGPHTKVLLAGEPAAFGVRTAYLAAEGFTGPLDLLDTPDGFYRHFSFMPARFFLEGLGRCWVTQSVAFKRYPGCAYIDTTIDALLEVLDRIEREKGGRIDPADVQSVDVEASLLTVEMERVSSRYIEPEQLSAHNINFSIPFNVAIVLLAGRLTPRQLDSAWLFENGDQLRKLASRVTLRHGWNPTLTMFRSALEGLGEMDLRRHITVRELRHARKALVAEYGRSLKIGLGDLRPLYLELSPTKARQVLARMRDVRGQGFENVNFEDFRLPFPATVTLRTESGEEFCVRRDIPLGAPGADLYPDAAVEKFRQEAGRVFCAEAVDDLVEAVLSMEDQAMGQLGRDLAGVKA